MAKVSFVNVENYDQEKVDLAVKQLFDSFGGAKNLVKRNANVLLKTNIVREMSKDKAGTTHPVVLCAIARVLEQECEANVVIGDSSGGLYTSGAMNRVYRGCGLDYVVENSKATLNQDFDFVPNVEIGGKVISKLDIINCFEKADVVINVGKLKTHSFTGFTGSAKNLFGIVPGLVKVELHSRFAKLEDFCEMLVDIANYAQNKIVLHFIDAIVGMEGAGPTNGKPRHLGKLFAGINPFELDAVAVSLFDEPYSMPLLKSAVARGLLKENFENIDCNVQSVKNSYVENYDRVKVVSNSSLLNLPKWAKFFVSAVMNQKVKMLTKKCKKCRKCEVHCPAKAIKMGKKKAEVDQKKCIRCFCCQELCPFDAVKIKQTLVLKIARALSRSKNKS